MNCNTTHYRANSSSVPGDPTSAQTGERTPKLLEMVEKVAAAGRHRVSTGELNRFIERLTTSAPPVTTAKRNVRVKYASQVSVAPPTIVLFTNTFAELHFSYERFVENRLREEYGFLGNPIRIQVRGGRRDERKEPGADAQAKKLGNAYRKPVKKGPGSKPTKAGRGKGTRFKAASPKGPRGKPGGAKRKTR